MAQPTTTSASAKQWFEALRDAKNILLASPYSPDGDSIGAQIAMRELIEGHWPKSKKVFMFHEEPVPPRYHVLRGATDFLSAQSMGTIPFDQLDLCIVLDGGFERIGPVLTARLNSRTPVGQVDHHIVTDAHPYKLRWWDPHASSTGEMVFKLLNSPPFDASKLNPVMAEAMYVSLIFDTGFFRHDCTVPSTLAMASQLYAQKIPFTQLAEKTMLLGTFAAKKLLAKALDRLELQNNGRLVSTYVVQKDFSDTHSQEDDKDIITEQIFLIYDVEVSVLFLETKKGFTKISFRSRTNFDVASFARTLTSSGGGHKKAAGCLIEEPLSQARPRVLKLLSQQLV